MRPLTLHSIRMIAAVVVAGTFLVRHERAFADPARFWMSTSGIVPGAPQAPDIPGIRDSARYIDIWAQPATVNSGLFNASTNPFKRLQNLSLDVVADKTVVNFLANTVVVYNPTVAGKKRYQYVHDSSSESTSAIQSSGGFCDSITGVCTPYHLEAIAGFTVNSTDGGFGGAACDASDHFCALTPSGSPAWLVASFATQTVSDTDATDYFMQIGERGISHSSELTSATSVIFGTDGNPTYNASADRQTSLGDAAHFILQAHPASDAVATNWSNGTADWATILGGTAPSFLNNVTISGGLVSVTGSQQANSTAVSGGRLDLASGASLASDVTVGNSGSISGNGSIGASLTLAGNLIVNPTGPMHVRGPASISGGSLSLPNGYSQAFGMSSPFVVLDSSIGVTGTFVNGTIGQQLATDATLASITYDPAGHTVTIQVKFTPGDFDHNNVVNAADYAVWRKGLGTTFTLSDYHKWRANFGNSLGNGVGSLGTVVPEPAAPRFAVLYLIGLLNLRIRSRRKLRNRTGRCNFPRIRACHRSGSQPSDGAHA